MPQHQMRTTLQLDDDVLAAARVLARQQRTSLGAVISELARQALVAPAPGSSSQHRSADHRNGLPLLPWKETGAPVDLELVNNLRTDPPPAASVLAGFAQPAGAGAAPWRPAGEL
jgi:hypothetical protein